jgi:hypothetical protein
MSAEKLQMIACSGDKYNMKTDTSKLRPSTRKIANEDEQEFNLIVQ